jgi:peptidoglycan/LPS O-acetylase OafA/YrhL
VYATIDERSKLIRRIFGNIYMRFLGKISYSLYIFHWPIYLIIKSFTAHFILDSIDITVNKFILGIVSTIAAIIVSTISFEYFEKPILQMKSKFNYKIT